MQRLVLSIALAFTLWPGVAFSVDTTVNCSSSHCDT
jgi:hypothetical protein